MLWGLGKSSFGDVFENSLFFLGGGVWERVGKGHVLGNILGGGNLDILGSGAPCFRSVLGKFDILGVGKGHGLGMYQEVHMF